jgi:hypothetical protein
MPAYDLYAGRELCFMSSCWADDNNLKRQSAMFQKFRQYEQQSSITINLNCIATVNYEPRFTEVTMQNGEVFCLDIDADSFDRVLNVRDERPHMVREANPLLQSLRMSDQMQGQSS